MEMQLDLIPTFYYSTLGFDEKLIMYLDTVEDSFVRELVAPLYKKGGRPTVDPVTYFRMHYLYFTRPEITSFRQLCKQLKDPKNQAWRNFILVPHIGKVPCHASLSNFRALVGPALFFEMLLQILKQAQKQKGFLSPQLAGIDSRPVFAGVNGYKKVRCRCGSRACSCSATYSDPDATCSFQRSKVNQNRFFVGYRKHSIVCSTPQGPVVLLSIVLPNTTADIDVLLPLVKKLKEAELPVEYLAADLGYYDADDHYTAKTEHGITVVTGFKKTTLIPEHCDEKGRPECAEGHLLEWDGFDSDTLTSWFAGDKRHCETCPLAGTCEKQFGFSFRENPIFFGPIPQSSYIQEQMLLFRKQVELAQAQESNRLTKVMKHKKLPVRGLARVQSYFALADLFQLIQASIAFQLTALPQKEPVKAVRQAARVMAEQLSFDLAS